MTTKNLGFETFLEEAGYKNKPHHIHVRPYGNEWLGYIVSERLLVPPIHSVGLVNSLVNATMYRTVAKVIPKSVSRVRPVSYAPALCFVRPQLLPDLVSSSNRSHYDGPISDNGNYRYWLALCEQFAKKYANLRDAVELAFVHNKYLQAQRYCLPVALLMLEDDRSFSEYTGECLERLQGHEKLQFQNYVNLLLAEHGFERRGSR